MAFDPTNPPNPELTDCWLVYRLDDGRGHLYDDEAVAKEAMAKHRHDGVQAFLFRSVRVFTCDFCGKNPATCHGGKTGFGCDVCCGHSGEEETCEPVADYVAEIQADTERLNYLESVGANPKGVTVGGICYWAVEIGRKRIAEGDNLREAIDVAREKAQKADITQSGP